MSIRVFFRGLGSGLEPPDLDFGLAMRTSISFRATTNVFLLSTTLKAGFY